MQAGQRLFLAKSMTTSEPSPYKADQRHNEIEALLCRVKRLRLALYCANRTLVILKDFAVEDISSFPETMAFYRTYESCERSGDLDD